MANDEFKLVVTDSSKSESSLTGLAATTVPRFRNVALHERCTMMDMMHLNDAFQSAYRNKMSAGEFRELIKTLLNAEYDDEHYNILFLKINTSRTGEIDWDELVSHLILGYFGNDAENQRESLQLPIMGLPVIMRSQHRHPISRICFCPEVDKDRCTDPMQGTYITASRDGMVNWWSLDMKLLRTGYSSSPHLKVRSTWVTDMVCMPDVNIIVTSSTERDLRFYDCTAKTFILKIIITSWECMICTMYYYFNKDDVDQCKLICGDVGGNVRVLLFSAHMRGPFRNDAGRALKTLRHIDLQKRPRVLPELRLVELVRVHPEWVRQVSYYASLHCVVSCATCFDSLLMCDLSASKTHKMFRVDKGFQCFAFDEEAHVLVTGGPDCMVRVWNPFVPAKANVLFIGHHSAVTCIVLQNKGQTIYSLSRDRTIKVWDVLSQVCRQTYIDIPAVLGERTPISAVYNPATREFILACMKIAVVVLDEQLNPLHTDGFTHSRAVSKVLYNPLFKVIITCGTDSIIINWNPITGKRNVLIRDAHVRDMHGEQIPVEITAACFDPGYQLLVTGARNGELKVWNFNTGLCLRTMSIEHMCEVTNCFWVEGRILAVGWNRHVVEFEDTGMATTGKSWEKRHTDDVLAAAARPPLTMATSSYNSELVLWKLETGQPYRRFSCTEPTLRIKMVYNRRESSKPGPVAPPRQRVGAGNTWSNFQKPNAHAGESRENILVASDAVRKATERRISGGTTTSGRKQNMRLLAVHAVVFLQTRPQHMSVASLLLALENGQIQCWSDHSAGGYQGSFQVIHMAGDYASCLATDKNNEFLFTGTTLGYVKVWLMTNYLINDLVHVNMPRLRLMFPFLWRDRIEGRAKRSVRDQPKPLLLNSYRAHLRSITSIAYIDEHKLVFTGSSDYSVRVWRLSGEYLQTLGSFLPWTLEVTRFPPDVKKVASFTTFKVWRSGQVSRYVPGQKVVDKLHDITVHELKTKTYGEAPNEPLLGKYSSLPQRPDQIDPIPLDDSLPIIPIYAHLRMASTQPVRRPPTPELVRETRLKRVKSKKTHFGSDAHVSQTITGRPSQVTQGQPAQSAHGQPTHRRQTSSSRDN
ncbi:WD repeat-containing protein on Y chromosome-like [Spodoptera litura]|uniref:WD repeat-containing protein on Y chromosome n=1 Tax=Spodoptera litura TaxID=69820 RepID=A0A9J7DMP6_SPOLT|nr:WD repeat-containing protein on Y chromosome-like [Spodoptera litura]